MTQGPTAETTVYVARHTFKTQEHYTVVTALKSLQRSTTPLSLHHTALHYHKPLYTVTLSTDDTIALITMYA